MKGKKQILSAKGFLHLCHTSPAKHPRECQRIYRADYGNFTEDTVHINADVVGNNTTTRKHLPPLQVELVVHRVIILMTIFLLVDGETLIRTFWCRGSTCLLHCCQHTLLLITWVVLTLRSSAESLQNNIEFHHLRAHYKAAIMAVTSIEARSSRGRLFTFFGT